MVRFVHSGDWQLGMTRSVLGDEAQARFAEARFTAIRRIGEIARESRCDFVLVCGDVFESNRVERRTLARALDAMAAVPVPVYLLPGNHDPLDAASVYRSAAFRDAAPAQVQVICDAAPRAVAPGVELVGAPWPSRRPEANPALAALASLGPVGPLRILAAHGGADAITPERRDATLLPLAPIERAIAEGRLHYAALGDRHSLTRLDAGGRIAYAGSPEPTDFDECLPGCTLVVELDRDGVRSEARQVGTWRFARPEPVALEGAEDLDRLEALLAGFDAKERTALRLQLDGRLDLRSAARLDALLERARDLFAGLDVRDAGLAIAPGDGDLSGMALAGFAARAAERLRDEARGGDGGARDALALLLRLAAGSEAAAG